MADTPTQQINADNAALAGMVQEQSNETLADDLAGTPKAKPKAAPITGPLTPAYTAVGDVAGKAAGDASRVAETDAQKAQVAAVNASPWTQLGNALATQYQQAEAPAQELMSGAQTVPGQNQAAQTALALLGESGSSPDAATLGAWAGAANAATAPVQQAEAAQGAAYAAEAGPITKAIQAYGQANALSEETAPEASWLSALASHVTSNLSYYGSVPTADVGVLEQAPGVATALQQAGGYGGQTGSGLTPLQDISVQNGKVTVNKGASTPGSPGTVSTASPPKPGVSAGS